MVSVRVLVVVAVLAGAVAVYALHSALSIVRGRRLAVEHVLGMLAAGDDIPTILEGYPWLEREDVLACIEYASQNWGRA